MFSDVMGMKKIHYYVLPLLLLTLPLATVVMSFESNSSEWIQLGPQDNNEGGWKNDWRDVEFASYQLVISTDGLDLRLNLTCYGVPGSEWTTSGGRYKWFFDVSDPSDMYLSGGNMVGAEYLIYVEYSEFDGAAVMYFFEDVSGDGSFNDETATEISNGFEIVDNSIVMTMDLGWIEHSTDLFLAWATDQGDPNRDAAPNNDRVDGKIGIAGVVQIPSITVISLTLGEAPSEEWKYTVTGPSYSESFNLPANGTWRDTLSVAGDYVIAETTKFGYLTDIDVEGDLDSGSDIADSQVIVDFDEGEAITVTFTNMRLPVLAVSVEFEPPANLDYDLQPLVPTLVQSAWCTDISNPPDGRIDVVAGKPLGVMVNFTTVAVSSSVDVTIEFRNDTPTNELVYSDSATKSKAELDSNTIFSFLPITINDPGNITLTGSYTVDSTTPVSLQLVELTVKETFSPPISYSYLYRATKKGDPIDYGILDSDDYTETVQNITTLINSTYPISSLLTDENYTGLAGASAVREGAKDPFKALRNDAIDVALDAQLRMGGTAIGVGIVPNSPGEDYFLYHLGVEGVAGLSFGPALKGVLVGSRYPGAGGHEVGHTYGLNWAVPEQYYTYPLFGKITSGVNVVTEEWMTGYDIMGAVAYDTLDDTWIDSETYGELFKKMVTIPGDPQLIAVSGIISRENVTEGIEDGVEFPVIWYSLNEGIPDTNLGHEPGTGDYSLEIIDVNNNVIDTIYFNATFSVRVGGYPGIDLGDDGNQIDQAQYAEIFTDFAAFSFIIELPEGYEMADISRIDVRHPDPTVPPLGTMDANDIISLERYDVDSWTTSSSFDGIENLGVVFKNGGKTGVSISSTNPGTIYLNMVVSNSGTETVNPKISIILPEAVDYQGNIFSPALALKGAQPVHLYSDLGGTTAFPGDYVWSTDETYPNIVNLELTIPSEELAYVTIHLDYALIGTEGWPKNFNPPFYQNLDFNIFAPHILEDGSVVTDVTVPFEAVES